MADIGLLDPSMVVQTSVVRKAKRGLADSRAMEEQHERMNPVNPRGQLMRNKNGVMEGGSATPSMGLSQYRGGKHTLLDHLKHPKKGYGTKKGMVRKTARLAYESESDSDSEAHQMGKHLGAHIKGLHGGAFHRKFMKGMGRVDDDEPEGYVRPVTQFDESGHRIPSSGSVNATRAAKAAQNYDARASASEKAFKKINSGLTEVGHKGLDKIGSVIPGSEKAADVVRALIPKRGSGVSEQTRMAAQMSMKKPGRSRNNGVPLLSGNVNGNFSGKGHCVGGSNTGAYEGKGRSARAAVVKKVMAEKGMKMIEASKYVKEHGLY